jgi:hypothetical protein
MLIFNYFKQAVFSVEQPKYSTVVLASPVPSSSEDSKIFPASLQPSPAADSLMSSAATVPVSSSVPSPIPKVATSKVCNIFDKMSLKSSTFQSKVAKSKSGRKPGFDDL